MSNCKDCGTYLSHANKNDLCFKCEEDYKLIESKQVGGSHYASQMIEPIDYIMGNKLGFNEGNVIKYVTRHKSKNGAEDIKKAIHYLEFILKYEYSERNENI